MKPHRRSWILSLAVLAGLQPASASAVVTEFFRPEQVATPVDSGVTSDQVSCDGYRFTYTRDKLFTGGGSTPIGRPVRIAWPDGLEAQYVTAGPTPTKAQIQVRRLDGAPFDLTSFTAYLLANAGAGRAIEIVPMLNGQEPLNDPLYFDVSGNYGNSFSYDTTPNPLGSTAALVGYDEYRINLTLDFALTALTLTDASPPSAVGPGPAAPSGRGLWAAPNPARDGVRFGRDGERAGPDATITVFSVRGERVRTLALGPSGGAGWDLRDDAGRPVPAGLYFAKLAPTPPRAGTLRIVVTR